MWNPFKKSHNSAANAPDPGEYERMVRVLAAMADQGASWQLIHGHLRNRGMTPDQLARWMTKYGGRWVVQPDPEFGRQLLQLSQVAEGKLASIARLLGRAIAEEPDTFSDRSYEPDPEVLREIEAYLQSGLGSEPFDLTFRRQPGQVGPEHNP